jgi:hypothetical protein
MKRLLIALLLIFPLSASAFDQPQKDALKAAVLAEPTIADCVTGGNDVCVADWLNTASAFVVWRTRVTQEEYQTAVSTAGLTFDWSGTGGYIARSQGERDAWRTMFSSGGVNPSNGNVILAFNDIFSGTGAGAINNRNHLLALSKRVAIQAEKALATGTGTTTTPGLLTWEGRVSINDIPGIMGR